MLFYSVLTIALLATSFYLLRQWWSWTQEDRILMRRDGRGGISDMWIAQITYRSLDDAGELSP